MTADIVDDRVHGEGLLSETSFAAEWRFYLSGLPAYLNSRIDGQQMAIERIARAVQATELGLNESASRLKCSFLFLGPTGVGKTQTAKSFTEYLFGSRSALEMIFMNEFSSDARLVEFLQWIECAVRRQHFALQPRDGFVGALAVKILAGPFAGGRQQFKKLRIVVKHFFEMRNEPAFVDRIPRKAAAEMVVDAAFADVVERDFYGREIARLAGAQAGAPEEFE